MVFSLTPVEERDKEESNWMKVEQLIKAGDSGGANKKRKAFNLHGDDESNPNHKEMG